MLASKLEDGMKGSFQQQRAGARNYESYLGLFGLPGTSLDAHTGPSVSCGESHLAGPAHGPLRKLAFLVSGKIIDIDTTGQTSIFV
jgi:hypothetical protein